MKPFNITEALAHPERVVHKDGSRAIQVAHFPEARHDNRVLILWEKSKTVHSYMEDGCVFAGHTEPALFLSTPPERVPFTVEDFKKGWEVVYREGTTPLAVAISKGESNQPVITECYEGRIHRHGIDGRYFERENDGQSVLDLFLLKPSTT